MDVALFHGKLLSFGSEIPDEFQLTYEAEALYGSGCNGVLGPLEWGTTVPTIVLALAKVWDDGELVPVHLIAPKSAYNHTSVWLDRTARHIFQMRKGDTEACRLMRDVWRKLIRPRQVLNLPEPERWVAFGFEAETPKPEWMEGKLVSLDAPSPSCWERLDA